MPKIKHRTVTVTLDLRTIAILMRLGGDNVSRGIRRAADYAYLILDDKKGIAEAAEQLLDRRLEAKQRTMTRNVGIVQRIINGDKRADIARYYDLTIVRVHQIFAAYRKTRPLALDTIPVNLAGLNIKSPVHRTSAALIELSQASGITGAFLTGSEEPS
jgi:hypothetical protein